jgi:hypothetical protein
MILPSTPLHYPLDEQRRIVAYLDSFPLSRDLQQARLASPREPHKGVILQSATGEELRQRWTLLPSVLDREFKGEL